MKLITEELPENHRDIVGVSSDNKTHYCYINYLPNKKSYEWRCSITGWKLLIDIVKWKYDKKLADIQ